MLPEPVREIVRKAAHRAMKNRRGKSRRKVYMAVYLKTRKLAIAVREAE